MNRIAPLAGLLIVGLLTGAIIGVQSNQILIPFIVQQRVEFNPSSYLSNQTFTAGQTGSLTLPNIMQAVIYLKSAVISVSTQVFNTKSGFTSLNFTLHFGPSTLILNGLQNATQTLQLTTGVYPITITITYTTVPSLNAAVTGSALIILSTS